MSTPVLITLIIAAVVLVITGVIFLKKRGGEAQSVRETLRIGGNTKMMGEKQIAKRSEKGDHALVIGEMISPDKPTKRTGLPICDFSDEPAIVFGPPGSGKTASQLVPSVISHSGPVFASTTKHDIIESTIRAREVRQQINENHSISIFDPGELLKDYALGSPTIEAAQDHVRIWTPIREAITWARARSVAEAMLTASSGADSSKTQDNSGFFSLHSTNIVGALLLIARAQPGSSLETILKRVEVLSGMSDDDEEDSDPAFNKEDWQEFIQDLQDIEDNYSEQAEEQKEAGFSDQSIRPIQNMARAARSARLAVLPSMGAVRANETRAGIIGAIGQLTTDWTMSPAVLEQPWDAPDTLDLETLAEDHTVYMTCPEVEQRPLANAFVGAYMLELQMRAARSGGKLKTRHLVVLDELVYCTPHSKMLSWANNLARSAGIKLFLGTQGLSDLEIAWGEAQSRTLLNSCKGAKILLPGCGDSKARAEFSTLAGKQNLIQVSSIADTKGTSHSTSLTQDRNPQKSKSRTITRSMVERDTASEARLAGMPAETALVWLPGQVGIAGGTVQVHTHAFYKEGTLMRRASEGDHDAVMKVSVPPRRQGRPVRSDDPLAAELSEEASNSKPQRDSKQKTGPDPFESSD